MICDCLRRYGRYGEEDCRLARCHGMYNTVVVIVLQKLFPTPHSGISLPSTLHSPTPDFAYVILHERRKPLDRLHPPSFVDSSTPSANITRQSTFFQLFSATAKLCKTTNGSILRAYPLPGRLYHSPAVLPRTMRAFSTMPHLITITDLAPAQATT